MNEEKTVFIPPTAIVQVLGEGETMLASNNWDLPEL